MPVLEVRGYILVDGKECRLYRIAPEERRCHAHVHGHPVIVDVVEGFVFCEAIGEDMIVCKRMHRLAQHRHPAADELQVLVARNRTVDLLEIARREKVVRVGKSDPLAPRKGKTEVARACLPAVFLSMALDKLWVAPAPRLDHVGRAVGGAVIDDHYLQG